MRMSDKMAVQAVQKPYSDEEAVYRNRNPTTYLSSLVRES